MLLKITLLVIGGLITRSNCQKLYCVTNAANPIGYDEFTNCVSDKSLSNCFKCMETIIDEKKVGRRCRQEILDDVICKQIVPKLDNCHNRCQSPCFCQNGSCRVAAPGGGGVDTWPCNTVG